MSVDKVAKEVQFDINELTLAEVEELEDLLDCPIDKAFSANGKKAKALRAIVWLQSRRTNPDFTWDEAGQVKMTEVNLGEPDAGSEEGND